MSKNHSVEFGESNTPLIRYEIAFPRQPRLLVDSQIAADSDEGSSAFSNTIPEQLVEEIKWEPYVDDADKLDYVAAVSSGIVSGLIDTVFVGELSLDHASEWGTNKIERFVARIARMEGYVGNDLIGAVRFLERKHPFAADGNTNDFGGGLHHHLRDFSHHFSIGGLFFSILTQLTGLVVGTDRNGRVIIVPIPETHRQCIGKNLAEKLVYGTINWFFHMVSDMAGSGGSLMGGTGIPGPLVSFMKELSALPFFKDAHNDEMGFRLWVSKLFNGTLLADHDESGKVIKGSEKRFDLRAEIGMLGEIGKQSLPVLINQCIVRGFYFCRRISRELHRRNIMHIRDLSRIAPEDVLPWGTPAMRRMVSISSGVFVGVDLADAAIRATQKRDPVTFLLRINYVGVATFAVACIVDIRESLATNVPDTGKNFEEAFEHELSDLGCLELNFKQARILHSLMHSIVEYDIDKETEDKRAARKRLWLDEWSGKTAEAASIAWAANSGYFMKEDALFEAIEQELSSDGSNSWIWLVALEAVCFKPYAPLFGDHDKDYRGLRLTGDYLKDVFCVKQSVIEPKGLKKLNNSFDKMRAKLNGSNSRKAIGAAVIFAAVASTGGIAFTFAPAIAPTLAAAFGAQVAGLSGAALTSASLAFFGGGALAVGGTGMAGGTVFIAGGGALIGAIGGSGISAITNIALTIDSNYVLNECVKLVVFSRDVLINRCDDLSSVAKIYEKLGHRILELSIQIENLKHGENQKDKALNNKEELSPKQMVKILNQSLKLLKRSRDILGKELAKR